MTFDGTVLAQRWLDTQLEARCAHGTARIFAGLCLDCLTVLATQAYTAGAAEAHQHDTCYESGYREGYAAGVADHVEHHRCARCYDAGKQDASHLA